MYSYSDTAGFVSGTTRSTKITYVPRKKGFAVMVKSKTTKTDVPSTEKLEDAREWIGNWAERKQNFQDRLSEDDPALEELRQIDKAYENGDITDMERAILAGQIVRRHRRFNVASQAQHNYHAMMDDLSEKWEEHVNGQLVKGRDFLYKAGDWLVRVTSSGVYTILYTGHRAVLMGFKVVAAIGATIWASIQVIAESLAELFRMAGKGISSAANAGLETAKGAGNKFKTVMSKSKDDESTTVVDGDTMTINA